jgi:hypothetical protein
MIMLDLCELCRMYAELTGWSLLLLLRCYLLRYYAGSTACFFGALVSNRQLLYPVTAVGEL